MKSVRPAPIDGTVAAPPSKSMTVRALAAAALVRGATRIVNPSICEDALAARRVIEVLGCRIETRGAELEIVAGDSPGGDRLDCGESGLGLRLFAAVAGLFARPLTLIARGSLLARPVDMVCGPLAALGAACSATDGRAPLVVRGPLAPGRARVDASGSSQFLTGLLMALPVLPGPGESFIEVSGLRSAPYLRMTLELLAAFGLELDKAADLAWFRIPAGQAYRSGLSQRIEGDWSGAAALLVAGALAGRARLTGLRPDSPQADRAILDALAAAGARVRLEAGRVVVERGEPRAFGFDATDCPDLFPPLVALACSCPGESVLVGAGRLHHKESDRAAALVSEFSKLGGRIRQDGDRLIVSGGPLGEAEVDSHGDHRIAMALAVGALGAGVAVRIRGADCVAKSYPGFFEDLAALTGETTFHDS